MTFRRLHCKFGNGFLNYYSFPLLPCFSHGTIHGKPANSPLRRSLPILPRWLYNKTIATAAPNKVHPFALPNYHMTGSEEDLSPTLVHEIVRTNKQVPEKYLQKEGIIVSGTDISDVWKEHLLVDLNLVSTVDDSSSELAQMELAKLRSALSEWGCLQVINHGIASSFLDELHQVSKQFFAVPLLEKLNYLLPDDIYNGYGNSSVIPGDKKLDWNDRFVLTLHPQDQQKLSVWPSNPHNFRKILQEYSLKLRMIQEQVLKAMARSLNLTEGTFLNQHGKEGRVVSRFAYYPPCACAAKVYGAHPHADTTTISILLPDKEMEGLEIQKGDEWFKVPAIIPGALYINLGDFAEVMSNGVFKSVVHRALTNSERERLTVNTFFSPEETKSNQQLNWLMLKGPSCTRMSTYKPISSYSCSHILWARESLTFSRFKIMPSILPMDESLAQI